MFATLSKRHWFRSYQAIFLTIKTRGEARTCKIQAKATNTTTTTVNINSTTQKQLTGQNIQADVDNKPNKQKQTNATFQPNFPRHVFFF